MIISFDDITTEVSPYQNIPNHYQGFSWDRNIYLISASSHDHFIGQNAMVTSGSYAILFDDYDVETAISSATRFDFLGAKMTSYGASSGQYQIKGFADGVEKYNITAEINSNAPSLVKVNFTDVDRVTFRYWLSLSMRSV